MSVFLTHLLVGTFIGVALGGRVRDLPIYAALAEWMDIDHAFWMAGQSDPFWMVRRGTFHNVFVVAIIPGIVCGYLLSRPELTNRAKQLLMAAPICLLSHTILDMFDVPDNLGRPFGGVYLFYPFDARRYVVSLGSNYDPRVLDGFAVGFLLIVGLIVFAVVMRRHLSRLETQARMQAAFVYGSVLGVLVPVGLWVVSQSYYLQVP